MECAIESCDRAAYCRELCQPHYKRWRRHGDVFADLPIGRTRRTCSLAGCENLVDAQELCHGRYQRLLRTGDVQAEVPPGRRRLPRCQSRRNFVI